MHPIARRIPLMGFILAAVLNVVACTPKPPESADPATAEFCAGYLTATQAFLKSPITGDPEVVERMDKAEIMAEAGKLAADVNAVQAVAPEELIEVMAKVSSIFDAAASSGDPAMLQDETLMTESGAIDVWAYDHCGWPQVPVTATDFALEGIPDTLAAGTTAFKLINDSEAEQHVLLITRRQPGVTGSAEDILSQEGDVFQSDLELVAATGAAPGTAAGAAVELTPGDYIAFCPLPLGDPSEGKLHYTLGEYSEFTVE